MFTFRVVRSRKATFIPNLGGVPRDLPAAYRFADPTREKLTHRIAPRMTPDGRDTMILDWAQARGRVSTTEIADLADISGMHANRCLTALEEAGALIPGRSAKSGRGFFYKPSGSM